MFYIAQYPVRWTAQSALQFSSPGRPDHSGTNSASLGSILAMQQLRNNYSLTPSPLSIARYSFIQLSGLRRREENEKCPNFETNTGSFDCESGILPHSYRVPPSSPCPTNLLSTPPTVSLTLSEIVTVRARSSAYRNSHIAIVARNRHLRFL